MIHRLFLVFDLEFFSIGLSFDNDLVTGVSQAVKDGIGNDGIGEELLPVGHGTIGREDDGFATEATIDKSVEALSGLLIDSLESKVVDNQEVSF